MDGSNDGVVGHVVHLGIDVLLLISAPAQGIINGGEVGSLAVAASLDNYDGNVLIKAATFLAKNVLSAIKMKIYYMFTVICCPKMFY